MRRIAISTFSLQCGKWIFTAGEPDPPLRETFEIPLDGVLVEGARSVDHISAYSGRWQYAVPLLFNEIPMASENYFTEAERKFYDAVQRQGRYSCQELIARLNVFPLEFWRYMLAFYLLGIVQFEKGEVPLDLSGEIAALLELNQRLQVSTVAGPELLGLAASASAAAVEKAKGEMLARFSPERFGSAAAPEIKNIARAVCRGLQSVSAQPSVPAAPEAEKVMPIETEWVVEMEPSPEERWSAESRPEAPAPGAGFGLSVEFAVEAEKAEEFELSAEYAIDVEAPAAAAIIDEAQLREESPEALPSEPPREFAPAAAPPSLRTDNADHEKAWNLLLHSKELYERHDYGSAVPLLKQAIRLEPNQGDFYYLLGLCLAEIDVMKHDAESNFKKAIELKSWSADPVYALGVFYRGQGRMKLAERCFQRVKEISYEHTGASRALVDLRRQHPGKKSKTSFLKKKIF